jgi:O-antigen/teichoic acid export membrane protein
MTTLLARIRVARSDQVLTNSLVMFATSLLMAAGGAIFWVVAARLQSPTEVGLASSLVAAADSLALLAQLGLNITLLRTMPTSDRKAADIATAAAVVVGAALVLALTFALLLPVTVPRLTQVLHSPATIAIFCVLVAGVALNILTDSIFLGINRVWSFFRLNGLFLGAMKCALPFLLVGSGAFGLYGSFGTATLLCGLASVVTIFRHVPGRRLQRPSRQLLDAKRFAGTTYLVHVLNIIVPQLVLPLLIINQLGPAQSAVLFISIQIVTLQNAIVFAVGNSMYAEAERSPTRRRALVRHGGSTMALFSLGGIAAMVVVAPFLLAVFGSHYADEGTATLRVLSLGTLGLAFNYWAAMRLRLAGHLPSMLAVQVVSTTAILGLAAIGSAWGPVWVAVGWGAGQLLGGLIGYGVSLTVSPLRDEPSSEPVPGALARELP